MRNSKAHSTNGRRWSGSFHKNNNLSEALKQQQKPDLKLSETLRSQGRKIKVINSKHAHVEINSVGTIEEVYQDGYCIRFDSVNIYSAFRTKAGASVFMGLGDVALITDEEADAIARANAEASKKA